VFFILETIPLIIWPKGKASGGILRLTASLQRLDRAGRHRTPLPTLIREVSFAPEAVMETVSSIDFGAG
jgi:hypothetical protein